VGWYFLCSRRAKRLYAQGTTRELDKLQTDEFLGEAIEMLELLETERGIRYNKQQGV